MRLKAGNDLFYFHNFMVNICVQENCSGESSESHKTGIKKGSSLFYLLTLFLVLGLNYPLVKVLKLP